MIVFKNKGLIDLRALTTFGVSSKVSENPIGIFGTGALSTARLLEFVVTGKMSRTDQPSAAEEILF